MIEVGIIGCGTVASVVHLPLLKAMDYVSISFLADLEPPVELALDFGGTAVRIPKTTASLPHCDIVGDTRRRSCPLRR